MSTSPISDTADSPFLLPATRFTAPGLLAAAVRGAAEAVLAGERLAVTVAARRIGRYGVGVFFPLGLGVRVTVGVAVGVLVGVDVTVGVAVGGAGVCVGAVLPQAGPVTVSE